MGSNAVSHHPPGSQLPITEPLLRTDQPANPSQRAAVKIQTRLDNAVTLPLQRLSYSLFCPLCRSGCPLCFSRSLCLSLSRSHKRRCLFHFSIPVIASPLSNMHVSLPRPFLSFLLTTLTDLSLFYPCHYCAPGILSLYDLSRLSPFSPLSSFLLSFLLPLSSR